MMLARLELCPESRILPLSHCARVGWSIVFIERSQVIIYNKIVFLSLKIIFVLANSADPDEMPHLWFG